jgi:hypothetical protein
VHPTAAQPRRSSDWIALAIGLPVALCLGVVQLALVSTPWLLSHRPSRSAWALERVREALGRQRDALLSGNESAYLGAVDTAMSKTDHDALLREYRSLRAMQVADVRDEVNAAFERGTDTWAIDLRTTACFVSRDCARGPALARTVWRIKGVTATLVSWTPDHESQPWQVSDLVAIAGDRTVVATTKAYASKLPSLLQEAEKAAKVADRFARDGRVPSRYVIYYAASAEWRQWFGADPPDWSGGVAIDVSDDRYDLMLNADQLYRTAIDDLLRHEMTHASTLPGTPTDHSQWWLIEGIAEYALMDGLLPSAHQGDANARDLISRGAVLDIEVTGPSDDSADDEVMGRYAIAYLGVRCMVERFGEAEMVEFFHQVVHDAAPTEQASQQVYGVPWGELSADCFGYVKQTLG